MSEKHDHDHEHEPHSRSHSHTHSHSHESHSHSHADSHSHSHELAHAHSHAYAHGLIELPRGAGRGKLLFFDAFSGAAGDMTIASLLDLGAPLSVVEHAIGALRLEGFHIHTGHAEKNAIVGTTFDVHVDAGQPLRNYPAIDDMLSASSLDAETKDLARRIFKKLGESEATVHRVPLDEVHFHEVGAVDAIVDIVGAAALITYLGADVVCSPLPMGRGFVRAAHGVLPLPAPAVVHCLAGCPTYPVDLDAELVTPTGAAIMATVAKSFARWPRFSPERSGFGAGQKDFPDRPNLLRAILGTPSEVEASTESGSHVLVEANVDDMTGELAANAIEALLGAGALDAWASGVTMKKGRPGLVVSAIATADDAKKIASAMLVETTSIGVRILPASRLERPRRVVKVKTPFGEVRCKVSEGPFGPPQVKPEYDDCRELARSAGVPLREVLRAAVIAASEMSQR